MWRKWNFIINEWEGYMQMSFHTNHTQKQTKKRYRKEKDPLRSHHQRIRNKERTSACTLQGSLSVEAALAAPVFFFALLCFVWIFEIMQTQNVVKHALRAAGTEMATESIAGVVGLQKRVENKIVSNIGAARMDQSYIRDGSKGLDCGMCKTEAGTTIMHLSVKYRLEFPIIFFRLPVLCRTESVTVKGWTGYEGNGFAGKSEETVYITATGLVYHKDPKCTYLDLSIRKERKDDVMKKYKPCKACGKQSGTWVYVTDYGESYHAILSCSKIRRTVYAVPLSEVFGRGGCERCTK